MFTYKTSGVCSRQINFDIVDGKLHNVSFVGGCPGNLAAIGKLVEGQDAKAIADLLKGNDCRAAAPAAPTNWQKLSPSIFNIKITETAATLTVLYRNVK